MSSYESVESTDAGIDLWRVQLGTGEIRAMSLDALDDAFQAGTIDEGTPVLPPGATVWAKLGEAAGLDTPVAESAAHSIAPIAVSLEPNPTGPATRYAVSAVPPPASLPDLDLDSLQPDAFKAKKGRVFVGIGLAIMFVGGLGFAATRLAPVTASASNALSAEAARKAAAAAPPPVVEDENAAARLKMLTEEQRLKLLEADKAREAREAAKKKDRPAPPARRSGSHPKTATPFVNGGNKYDPLNGAL